jgi:hypothetical protein
MWAGNVNGRYHLGSMGRYGRIILKQMQNKMHEDVDWIEIVQDRCTIMEVCVL